jgi:F0F1-type ATP synthase assembly protein I
MTEKTATSFSVIRFTSLLEKEIAKVDQYPLCSDNFIIQQDAYKRLASLGDDELDEEPAFDTFATLDCNRKEADSDMRFAIEMNVVGIILSIEGVGGMFFEYSIFKNEKSAVSQVIALLKMLCNGQISCLVTLKHGVYCCSEILLYEKGNRIPKVLATDGDYKWWWRKDDETGYETDILRNKFIKEELAIPKDLFFIDRESDGSMTVKGRAFKKAELTPLTKKGYGAVLQKIGKRLMDQKDGEDEYDALSKHWEFWLISVLAAGTLVGGAALGYLPKFLLTAPFIPMIVGSFVGGALGSHVIMRKVELKKEHPDHPWIRFDAKVSGVFQKGKKNTDNTDKKSEDILSSKNVDKASVRVQKALTRQVVFGYVASIMLGVAAWLYRTLPDSSVKTGNGLTISLLVAVAALVSLNSALLTQKKILRVGIASWIANLTLVGVVAGWVSLIKDDANSGSDTAFFLMLAAVAGQAILCGITEGFERKAKNLHEAVDEKKED